MAFCSNCGKELDESDVFCTNCGVPIKKTEVLSGPEQPVDYITGETGYIEPELAEVPDEPVSQEEQIPKGLFSDGPINNAVSSNDGSSSLGGTKEAKKSKKKWLPLILLSVFLTILVPVGIYFIPHLGRQIELRARYLKAKKELAAYTDYYSNNILSINEELKEIYDLGYENAYDNYVESSAATALYFANYSQYEKAIETIDPIKDFNAYTSNKYEEVAKIVFDHGVDLYNKGSFDDARDCFNMISSYSNAASYKAVCDRLNRAATSNDYAKLIKEAFSYDDVPNIENVIFKNEDLTNRYLVGKWSASGDYYFNMSITSNGYTFTTNTPMLYHEDNDYYYFIDNKMYFQRAGHCFSFNISSYNEMSIYSKSDGRTYRFYRK